MYVYLKDLEFRIQRELNIERRFYKEENESRILNSQRKTFFQQFRDVIAIHRKTS